MTDDDDPSPTQEHDSRLKMIRLRLIGFPVDNVTHTLIVLLTDQLEEA
jgi:hypothetical protein